MAISIDDIKKLRAMTGAGLADVKKALTEAEGDFDKAKELLRERGLAIAAKRSDRETSNGCVLVKSVDGFAAMIALKCETDFVANGADFIALTQSILDAAIAAKAKDIEAVKALDINGQTAQEAVTQRSGITGEKMELDGYLTLEGENIEVYDHMGKHMLCTMVQTNIEAAEVGHKLAMQVAAMKPVALDSTSMPQSILDAAIAAKAKDIEAVKALDINGQTAQEAVTQRSGITGEKMELDGYLTLEGENIEVYNHMGKNTLCTMVQTNKPAAEQGHLVAMQVAAMKPVALDAQSIDPKILDEEYKTAVEKSKLEQVQKFVDMKLKKAGLNPNLVDSEDHIESNMSKGWLTQEQADEARKIIADAKVEGEANLKMPMIEGIAKGRVEKFKKENCLVDQEFQFGDGDKATVAQWLAKQDKDLKIVAFQRFTLVAD